MPDSTTSAPALVAHRLRLHARHSSDALRGAPFFQGWTDDELEHFERIVYHVRFQTGDALIREDAPGQAFLIILEGEAEVSQHGRPLRHLYPGDHAGEMALIDDSAASATVVARSDVEALALYPDDFHNLLETIPSLGRRILSTLARRFRQTPPRDS
jgi:CRP/FNR family transcriptional regulator, cyclic AMP receptor protein